MSNATVGDDVYGEDPSVNELERLGASILGKPSAIFAPSGTQSNLIALLTHCARGDEYICGSQSHTYKYEGGGAAVLGGIQPNPLEMRIDGTFSEQALSEAIKPNDVHFARSRLVCLENTYAGNPIPLHYAKKIKRTCIERELALHLDGARIFNAAVACGVEAKTIAKHFDTVSVCLSKGLGAPVGSLLMGSPEFIREARRWRKVLGGGLRQAGVLAAAGIYALKNNVRRLDEDHEKALEIAATLNSVFGAERVSCQTNMVHLRLSSSDYERLACHLYERGIKADRPRWVFHKDITMSGIRELRRAIKSFNMRVK